MSYRVASNARALREGAFEGPFNSLTDAIDYVQNEGGPLLYKGKKLIGTCFLKTGWKLQKGAPASLKKRAKVYNAVIRRRNAAQREAAKEKAAYEAGASSRQSEFQEVQKRWWASHSKEPLP